MKSRLCLHLFTRTNMKRQLLTLFLSAIMIPIVLIGGIISFFTYRKMVSDYQDLTLSQVGLIHSTFVSTSIYLHSIAETVRNDTQLQNLFCSYAPESKSRMSTQAQVRQFEEILSATATVTNLRLYAPMNLMHNVEPNQYILPLTKERKESFWYQKSTEISGSFWMSDIRTGQNNMEYWELHYCCRIPIPKKRTYAVLVLSVSNDYLRNLISNKNYDFYITVNDDPVFISSDRSKSGQPFPMDMEHMDAQPQTGIFTVAGKKTVASLKTAALYQSSDKLHILVADTNALPSVRRLLTIFILIMLFALLISAVIIFLYASYFSARINTLRLAMYKVSNNDYEIVDTIRGDDELTATFRDMKVMVSKLKRAEAEIYQAQIHEQMIANQQQQTELKLLANQINPHFLYNTLETIRMKAFVEGNKEVAHAIKLLSKSMRYVLSNTKATTTTLDKELDYISTYLAIQKLRFGSRINYDIQADSSLNPECYQILPILLQPMIENAISHGLKDMEEGGHIILRIRPSKDRTLMLAQIFDNGAGMSPEKLEDVAFHLDHPAEQSQHGIGLYNINNRIRLFYGREYGLSIKSKEKWGTCVTVTIPLYNNTEEDEP